jgi:hypothetical protein
VTPIRGRRLVALAVALAIAVLAGLTAFGLWHVVVGGLLHGNGRAAAFGMGLAAAGGGLLAGGVVAFRRLARA